MKKIIATVLAMVMALALCTVAFAAEKYELVDVSTPNNKNEVTTVAVTNASTTTTDGVVSGSVAMYTLTGTGLTETKFVEASAENATHILYKDGAIYKYLVVTSNDGKYNYVGEVYNTFGTKCGDMKKTDSAKEKTFFTAKDGSKTTNYYVETTETSDVVYLLVKNEVVKVKLAKKDIDYTVVAHDFTKASGATYTFAADGTLATAKCATCGAVYTYTKYYTVAAAAKDSVAIAANALYTGSPVGYLYTGSTPNPSTDKNTSPKTFDAGIAMYVGMALTSVAGSAVVIGKKKEF